MSKNLLKGLGLVAGMLLSTSALAYGSAYQPAKINVYGATGMCPFKLPDTPRNIQFTIKGDTFVKLSKDANKPSTQISEEVYMSIPRVLKEKCKVSDSVLNSKTFAITGVYGSRPPLYKEGFILLDKVGPVYILYTK